MVREKCDRDHSRERSRHSPSNSSRGKSLKSNQRSNKNERRDSSPTRHSRRDECLDHHPRHRKRHISGDRHDNRHQQRKKEDDHVRDERRLPKHQTKREEQDDEGGPDSPEQRRRRETDRSEPTHQFNLQRVKIEPTSDNEAREVSRLNRSRPRGRRQEEVINDADFQYGVPEVKAEAAEETVEKQKPNFGLSGKLAEEKNVYNGVVIKYR